MTIVRVRAEIPDDPAELRRVAATIAGCGGRILGLDVQAVRRPLSPAPKSFRRRPASFYRPQRIGARL